MVGICGFRDLARIRLNSETNSPLKQTKLLNYETGIIDYFVLGLVCANTKV